MKIILCMLELATRMCSYAPVSCFSSFFASKTRDTTFAAPVEHAFQQSRRHLTSAAKLACWSCRKAGRCASWVVLMRSLALRCFLPCLRRTPPIHVGQSFPMVRLRWWTPMRSHASPTSVDHPLLSRLPPFRRALSLVPQTQCKHERHRIK